MKPGPAKKRVGQHFLTDPHVLDQIVHSGQIKPGDLVMEIGPGQGVLTEKLLQAGAQVYAFEIDRDLIQYLKVRFKFMENFHLVEGDALQSNWEEALPAGQWKMAANLPYNISSPLFYKMIEHKALFTSLTLMLQKEVALRLQERGEGKNKKDYGALSVASALHFTSKLVCMVPPGAFSPPPKVDSAVIRLQPKEAIIPSQEDFFRFCKLLFSNRRKQLGSSLKKQWPGYEKLSPATLAEIGQLRPENLSPERILELFLEGIG